jgi:hypothetical protein
MTSIYRYKLSNDTEELLNEFARTFFHLSNKELSDEWNQFQATHASDFEREETRLREMGYDGDINAKIYRSLRYYHIKRYRNPDTFRRNIIQERKQYQPIPQDIQLKMTRFFERNCDVSKDKPQVKFLEFVRENDDSLLENIQIKKAFKNMFYRYKTRG